MGLELSGWDMHDINLKLRDKTFFETINIYKDQKGLLSVKSQEYLQAVKDDSVSAKERIEKEFTHLEKERCVIAIHIADELSKVSNR